MSLLLLFRPSSGVSTVVFGTSVALDEKPYIAVAANERPYDGVAIDEVG